jgi:hypothetical protein
MAKSKPPMPLLDVFILSLLEGGIDTLYRLKHEAGISIGAASPALRRLEKLMISRRRKNPHGKDIIGPRGKHEYVPGLFSHQFFGSNWLEPFENSLPTDTESVARLIALAESANRADLVKRALSAAIKQRRARARRATPAAGKSTIANRYRTILHVCETARLRAEAAALKKILAGLK